MTHPFSNIFAPGTAVLGTHVLILMYSDSSGLAGIWGPYGSEEEATLALNELKTWPIEGSWDVVKLRPFPVPGTPSVSTTNTSVCRDLPARAPDGVRG